MKNQTIGFLNKLTVLILLSSLSLFASIGKITAVNGQVSIERGGKTIEAKASGEIIIKSMIKTCRNIKTKTVVTIATRADVRIGMRTEREA